MARKKQVALFADIIEVLKEKLCDLDNLRHNLHQKEYEIRFHSLKSIRELPEYKRFLPIWESFVKRTENLFGVGSIRSKPEDIFGEIVDQSKPRGKRSFKDRIKADLWAWHEKCQRENHRKSLEDHEVYAGLKEEVAYCFMAQKPVPEDTLRRIRKFILDKKKEKEDLMKLSRRQKNK